MPRVAVVNDIAGVATTEVSALRAAGWDAYFHEVRRIGARWPRWAKVAAAPLRLALTVPLILRLRRGRYDIVHVHFVSQGFLGALSGRPFVLHAHGSDLHQNLSNPVYRAWTRMWMRRARAILYVTPNLKPYLNEFAAKARLVPNPVDTKRFAGIQPPSALRSVLIFMRLEPIKGARKVFDAVDELSRSVAISAMAWGQLTDELRRAHGSSVTFLDPVPHDEVPALIGRFDAVVGQMEQGVPGLSELEAMSAARPVFMRLDFADGDPPPVVNVAGTSELVAAVARLRDQPKAMVPLGEAGRAWVERRHGLKPHIDALTEIYREALATPR